MYKSKVQENTIVKNRTRITLFYKLNEECWQVVMQDLITDKIIVMYDFDDKEEAVFYFSDLYDQL